MTSGGGPEAVTAWYSKLPPIKKAHAWEELAPGTAAKLLAQLDKEVRH